MSNNSQLALLGGPKTIKKPLKRFNTIGDKEIKAVTNVMKSGILSNYLGAWSDGFLGGPKVREFEEKCKKIF